MYYKSILFNVIGIVINATMWQGVLVNPLEKAYEKPPERETTTADEMEVSATEA